VHLLPQPGNFCHHGQSRGIDSNQANMAIVIQDYRIIINYVFDIGSFMVIAG
jgi:hypothetical protein